MTTAELDVGQLVRVRGQQWVVSDLSTAALPTDEEEAKRVELHQAIGRLLAEIDVAITDLWAPR